MTSSGEPPEGRRPERRGWDPERGVYTLGSNPGHSRAEEPDPDEVGELLARFVRDHRESLGLSQQDAAKRAQISKTTWQQVEGGHGVSARNLTIRAVARALGIEPAILFNLRGGTVSIPEADELSRTRDEIIAAIVHGFEWLRQTDLLAIEDAVKVRVELRRRQRVGEPMPEYEAR